MADIDKMYLWLEEFKSETDKLIYDKDDIRYSFYGLLYDIGNNYYNGYMMFDMMHLLKEKNVMFDKSLLIEYNKHLQKAVGIVKNDLLNQSYYNSLNRNFLFSTWSSFELCVTTLCETLSTTKEKEELLKWQFTDIEKKLKHFGINEDGILQIEKKMVQKHLTHVPIDRKIRFLHNKSINYSRHKEEDLKTLIFFGKFRNTMHSNFIYHGEKDFEFCFKGKVDFTFSDKKVILVNDKFYNGKPQLYFDMLTEFKEIWKAIITSIDFKDIIPHPTKD